MCRITGFKVTRIWRSLLYWIQTRVCGPVHVWEPGDGGPDVCGGRRHHSDGERGRVVARMHRGPDGGFPLKLCPACWTRGQSACVSKHINIVRTKVSAVLIYSKCLWHKLVCRFSLFMRLVSLSREMLSVILCFTTFDHFVSKLSIMSPAVLSQFNAWPVTAFQNLEPSLPKMQPAIKKKNSFLWSHKMFHTAYFSTYAVVLPKNCEHNIGGVTL